MSASEVVLNTTNRWKIARGTFNLKARQGAYDQAVAVLVEECPSAFFDPRQRA